MDLLHVGCVCMSRCKGAALSCAPSRFHVLSPTSSPSYLRQLLPSPLKPNLPGLQSLAAPTAAAAVASPGASVVPAPAAAHFLLLLLLVLSCACTRSTKLVPPCPPPRRTSPPSSQRWQQQQGWRGCHTSPSRTRGVTWWSCQWGSHGCHRGGRR